MRLHANARTCPNSRALIARRVLDEGWSLRSAAAAAGVSEPTARKWVRRAAAGEPLEDRPSTPGRIPHRTPRGRIEAITALRRLRMTAAQIAELLGMALSTVSLWLKRTGLGKRSRLDPPEPPNRYERRHPGELVHIDIKTLGRISSRGAGHRVTGDRRSQISTHRGGRAYRPTGFEHVHVIVDDYSRLAYAEVLDALTAGAAIGFLERAVAWFAERGIQIERVMTDNGSAYVARAYRQALARLGIRQLRTRPYRPRTNGKAERFIQTLLNEWAYARVYGSSSERTAGLEPWLIHYNYRRRHGSLGHQPPGSRINNLVGNYS
jgi:transposase InsO family protein